MKLHYFYFLLVISAFIGGSCNFSAKLTSESKPYKETICDPTTFDSMDDNPTEFQPSGLYPNAESLQLSNEIVFYSSTENSIGESVFTENDLIISPKQEILPDTLPADEWLSQSQLARESKIAGIWGLALFIIVPYLSIVFGIIALSKGLRAKKTIARAPEKYINANDAVAGIVMGSIIVGLFVLGLIALTIYIMAASGIINLPDW